MEILALQNVEYSYDKKKKVLKGINAQMETGKMYAILGPSGCGKTTLLSLLGGLDSPTNGQILFNGTDIEQSGLGHHRKKHVSFIFQSYNLVPVLNVYENIALPVELDGQRPDGEYMDRIIKTLGLEEKIHNLPNQLSGGQQQRVAIARALITQPDVIFADEPTGNLDSKTSQDVMGFLKVTSDKFRQTIVMITHNEEIAQMADRIVRIEDGKLVANKERRQ